MSTTELIDNTIQSQLKTDKSQTPGLTPEQIELAKQEKEGQYKIWLEMPQTKELIAAHKLAIDRADKALDQLSCSSDYDKIKGIAAQRLVLKSALNIILTGIYPQ